MQHKMNHYSYSGGETPALSLTLMERWSGGDLQCGHIIAGYMQRQQHSLWEGNRKQPIWLLVQQLIRVGCQSNIFGA